MDRISKLPKTDRISNIPPSIIETILCLLPFQEAARTSILSRGWRYHWIRIPKLVFIEDMFQVPTDEAELLWRKVWQALYSCSLRLDHILHHLSRRKTIKKLTLDISLGNKLPLYSLLNASVESIVAAHLSQYVSDYDSSIADLFECYTDD
ncbi:F-box/FBD/LRR-repeat protein-like protein [Tanacetum coccineum]